MTSPSPSPRTGRVRLTTLGRRGGANPEVVGEHISTWMITIGTHTKAYVTRENGDQDFQRLKFSLENVIEQLFNHEERLVQEIFYKVRRYVVPGGRPVMVRDPDKSDLILGPQNIISIKAISAVEQGYNQGRIDAHIIVKVKHRLQIQLDCKRFGEMVDEELQLENLNFINLGFISGDPRRPGSALHWAEPKVYVSFRSLGQIDTMSARRYIGKQQKSDQVITVHDYQVMMNLHQQVNEPSLV